MHHYCAGGSKVFEFESTKSEMLSLSEEIEGTTQETKLFKRRFLASASRHWETKRLERCDGPIKYKQFLNIRKDFGSSVICT